VRRWIVAGAACLLAACGSQPRVPEWQMNAHDSLGRSVAAFLGGGDGAAASEFTRARRELASTGDAALVARAELTRCAVLVASLVMDPCTGFDALRDDAPAAERAYADYLQGRLDPAQAGLLPVQHRAIALTGAGAAQLREIADPLSRLVAAGVLLRSGRATPEVLTVASDTASAQGWRRPLLAWLGVQLRRANASGDSAQVERLRRRIALAAGER
jgi:hypothetical protein